MTETKQTKIGKIPEDWEVVKIEDVISLEYGKGLSEKQRKKGEFPVFGSNGIVGSHSDYLVEGPGMIAGRKGTIGAINWSEKNFWPIDTTYYIKLKKSEVDLRWLYYKLISLKLSRLNMATGTPGLNRDLVYAQNIVLPPLPEQKAIAQILSTEDEAIQKSNEIIAKTERLKKGLMQELLTKGIGHEEFKDTEIGRIPKEWEVVRLRYVSLDFISGGTPSTIKPEYWNGNIHWMTSAHITGKDINQGMKNITKDGVKNSATKIVPKNSILIATRVGIGKVAINRVDMAISQDLTGVVPDKEKINADFCYWLLSSFTNKLKSLAQGSTIKGLLRKEIEKIKIPLPPLPEQQKIASILSTIDRKLSLEKSRKQKLERIKQGLMNDLLTGRKRVKRE